MKSYIDAAAAAGAMLRPMTDGDHAFCERLYASTRLEELAVLGWPDEAVQGFLAQQFHAQHSHYQQHYAAAGRWIIEHGGVPVGRLIVFDSACEVEIVDIALLPEARGLGIGGALIAAVQAQAVIGGKSVNLHAEKNNPARSLYFRLGFTVTEDRGVYDFLEWRAG